MVGGADDDILQGGVGDDTLDGGSDGTGDVMTGGDGNDTYFVDSDQDEVQEFVPSGTDTVIASINDFDLVGIGLIENLTLASGAGILVGTGTSEANKIIGNENSNTLLGLDGADTLIGELRQ